MNVTAPTKTRRRRIHPHGSHRRRRLQAELLERRDLLAAGVFGESNRYIPFDQLPGPGVIQAAPLAECFMFTGCTQTIKGEVPSEDQFFYLGSSASIEFATSAFSSSTESGATKYTSVDDNSKTALVNTSNPANGFSSISVSGNLGAYTISLDGVTRPEMTVTSANHDPNFNFGFAGTGEIFGPFLHSVPLNNKFDLMFNPPIPSDLKVEYRINQDTNNTGGADITGAWQEGSSFTIDTGTFPIGTHEIEARVLDGDKMIYFFGAFNEFRVIDDLRLDVNFKDEVPGFSQTWKAEEVRFLDDVDVGTWKILANAPYVPPFPEYQTYEQVVILQSEKVSADNTQSRIQIGGSFPIGSTSDVSVVPHATFDDLIKGEDGTDYQLRLALKRGEAVTKPVTRGEPVFVATVPTWTGTKANQVTYGLNKELGDSQFTYSIPIDKVKLRKDWPTTDGTPFELFDGLKTFVDVGLDMKLFASPSVEEETKVILEGASAQLTILGKSLVNESTQFFPKSGLKVKGKVEARLLSLKDASITISTAPKNIPVPNFQKNFKPFNLAFPLVSTGVVGLNAELNGGGAFEFVANDLSVEASVQIGQRNGDFALIRDETFVKLNVDLQASVEINGKAALTLGPSFKLPANATQEQKDAINGFEIVSVDARGDATAFLKGPLQANFSTTSGKLVTDFNDTDLKLSGKGKLEYEVCFFNNDTLRDLFGLQPCGQNPDGSYPFKIGPYNIFGKASPPPNPNDASTYKKEGMGLGAGGQQISGVQPIAGGDQLVLLSDQQSAEEPEQPTSPQIGSLQFNRLYDDSLQQVNYQFQVQSDSQTSTPGKHFLEVVLVSDLDEIALEGVDLSTLTYSVANDGFSTGSIDRTANIGEGQIPPGEAYRIEFRLLSDVDSESVEVLLTGINPTQRVPTIDLSLADGDLSDGEVNFGPDSQQTTAAEIIVTGSGELPFEIGQVETTGSGFALLDPPRVPFSLVAGSQSSYRVRLTDPSQPATGLLRIIPSDPALDPIELPLVYDGNSTLTSDRVADSNSGVGAPTLNSIPNFILREEDTLTVNVTASDPTPGDGLVFILIQSPPGATIDATTGMITWQPSEQQLGGIYSFRVQAAEPTESNLSAERSFEVTLEKTNQPPGFSVIPRQQVSPGDRVILSVAASDADLPAQPLFHSLDPDAPAGASLDPVTGRFEWQTTTATAPGRYEFPVTVTDGTFFTSTSFAVDVLDENAKPLIDAIARIEGTEDEPLSFAVNVSDPNGDTATLQLVDPTPEGVTLDPSTGQVSWTPGETDGNQERTIVIEAIDGRDPNLVSRHEVIVDVAEVNSPPMLDIPETIEATVGQLINFPLNVIDTDLPVSDFTTRLGDRPSGARITTDGFAWVPDTEGQFTVTFDIRDFLNPSLLVSQTLTINVFADPLARQIRIDSPAIQSIPSIFGELADPTGLGSLQFRFSNPATDFVDVTQNIDEDGFFTIRREQLESALGFAFANDASFTVELQAEYSDGAMTTAFHSFTVDLVPPGQPTIALPPQFDSEPLGDLVTEFEVVDIFVSTEPFATIVLADGRFVTADENGEATVANVSLLPGNNRLDWTLYDSAGNPLSITQSIARSGPGGIIGPDIFGYTAHVVPHTFTDISQTGTLLIDEASETGLLTESDTNSFGFTYQNTRFREFTVFPDGKISFGDGNEFLTPTLNALIFDFDVDGLGRLGQGVYWQIIEDAITDKLVIQWNVDAAIFTDDLTIYRPVVFQAALDLIGGGIQYNYRDLARDELDWPFVSSGISYPPLFGEGFFGIVQGDGPNQFLDDEVSVRILPGPDLLGPALDVSYLGGNQPAPFLFDAFGSALDPSGIDRVTANFTDGLIEAFDITSELDTFGDFTLDPDLLNDINGEILGDGIHTLNITATDNAGNVSVASTDILLDLFPARLRSIDLARGSDTFPLGDLSTELESVNLVGKTEPNVTVTLLREFQNLVTFADDNGDFQVKGFSSDPIDGVLPLELGENEFTIEIFDGAHTSSSTFTITRTAVDPSMPGTFVGPDAFNYWARSTTPQFDDIRTTGNLLLRGVDDQEVTLQSNDLQGLDFNFYGISYNAVRVDSNGGILFGDESSFGSGFDINFGDFVPVIAALGEDLLVPDSLSSGVYWKLVQRDGQDLLVLQWTNVKTFSNNENATFQLILNLTDDSILFNYHPTEFQVTSLDRSSVGIRDENRIDFEPGELEKRLEVSPQSSPISPLVSAGVSVRISPDFPTPGSPQVLSHQPLTSVKLDQIDIQFDRPVDTTSFSIAEDIAQFSGPTGDLISVIEGFTWVNSRALRLHLAPQLTTGIYTLVLNPSLASEADGSLVDQDQDGTAGEVPDDQFVATIQLNRCSEIAASGYQSCLLEPDTTVTAIDQSMADVFVIVDDTENGFRPVDLSENTFRFYDTVATGAEQLFVSTNGLITFGSGSTLRDPAGDRLPEGATIAPLWDDWSAEDDDDDPIVLGQFKDLNSDQIPDQLIIQWTSMEHAQRRFDVGPVTFQTVLQLNANGDHGLIDIHYLDLQGRNVLPINSSTVAIKNDVNGFAEKLVVSSSSSPATPLIETGRSLRISQTRPSATLSLVDSVSIVSSVGGVELSTANSVANVQLEDFSLTQDGQPLSLENASLSGADGQFMLNLESLQQEPGDYVLTFATPSASTTQIRWTQYPADQLPTDITLSNTSVPENSAGANIGEVLAVGVSVNTPILWLTSDSRFEVVDAMLQVANGATIDFEQDDVIEFTITAINQTFPELNLEKLFSLTVEDLDDPATNIQLTSLFIQSRIDGAIIGTLQALDQDSPTGPFSVVNDARFTIVDGELRLANGEFFDNQEFVTIEVAIGSGETEVQGTFTLSIQQNELPWQNLVNRFDVTGDNQVTALDALVVINILSRGLTDQDKNLPRSRPFQTDLGFFDVNGDGKGTALDALQVINAIAREVRIAGEQIDIQSNDNAISAFPPSRPTTGQEVDALTMEPLPDPGHFSIDQTELRQSNVSLIERLAQVDRRPDQAIDEFFASLDSEIVDHLIESELCEI